MKKILILSLTAALAFGLFHSCRSRSIQPTPKGLPKPEELRIQKNPDAVLDETRIKKETSGRIAIVLDDFGYNTNNLDALFALGEPITLSILPNLMYSEKIARMAAERNYETILHLPLEPHEESNPQEEVTISCSMNRPTVIKELDRAIESVPGVKGISNHMGSKATEDERLMEIIFNRAKKKNLFFLDSLVTAESVCSEVARKTGLRFVQRSIFLDNSSDINYIKKQIRKLASKAIDNGSAIGIGHDRPNTLIAIKEMAHELKKNGIKFVFLSELVR